MKPLQYLILLVMAGFLFVAVAELPPRGDIGAPVQQKINPAGTPVAGAHYIEQAYKDTHTPNIVAVVLADYRAFDTLGEVIVVFAGAIGCFFVLRRRP
ncbi:hydrogen gas-evolving membrane-bound hydrogenase subunit E [Desulfonatronovibrio hydrogenovorans]|uniref:hydrogen gas-evolving membrane-bound hydrogenase subunit E n=1 Tax=Desulfonatronovibrio hydrogenovorans TaxID=53245 RepID=UPI00048C51DC|nr:hydrogen gas-evolving membrane-bound hydrogenase subunit E [Desulfonatronovibrio hydrogenovorans]